MFNRGSLRSKKLIQKRKRKFLIKLSFFVFFIFLFFSVLVFFSRADFMKVESIEVAGNLKVDTQNLEHLIIAEISDDYFYLFPKDNFLFFPKNKIKKRILNEYMDIKIVEVKKEDFKNLILSVEERENFALWCLLEEINGQTIFSNDCFFIDSESFAFSEAFDFNSSGFFRYFKFSEDSPIGKNFIDKTTFSEVNIFIAELRDLGLKPVSFLQDRLEDFEIYFEGGEKIIFKSDSEFKTVLENLSVVLLDRDLKFMNEEGLLPWSYIDLRFGNKVFYSLK